jgi:hypothetical protein
MFNLLPKDEQHLIEKEYRLRLAIFSLLFLGVFCVSASVALVPSIFLSTQKEAIVFKSYEKLKAEVAVDTKDNPGDILNLSIKKAKALSEKNPDIYSYELIGKIVNYKIPGIRLVGVSVRKGKEVVQKTLNSAKTKTPAKPVEPAGRDISITGKAKDRDTLLKFSRILESEKSLTKVNVPVSNFAPASDINFTITAKAK